MNVGEEKIAELKGMAEEIMLEGDPGRQWHAQELLEELPDDYSLYWGAGDTVHASHCAARLGSREIPQQNGLGG